jgi:DnaJ-class molecular chaperone
MAEPAPKCPHCDGWALEPGKYPAEPCTVCAGTGRPRAADPSPQTGELLDG